MNKFLLLLTVSLFGISHYAFALSSTEIKHTNEPLNMDCSDGVKITTNDVDNLEVNACGLGYCNGKTFCQSKTELKDWDAAVKWCHVHGGTLVDFNHLCPRPEEDRFSSGGVCPNLAGLLNNKMLWTNTQEQALSYYVFINKDGVPYFSVGRKDQKGYAVCDNSTLKTEQKSDKIKDPTKAISEYTLGNPNGTFIIKAFYDYQCGWCRRSNEALNNMLQSDKAKNIKIVLMPNPIFGEKSELITKYVLASANQGKLTEMHNAVFNKAPQDENILIDIAKSLGMDTQRLKEDAYSAQIKTKLQKNQQMARQLNLQGVPAFVINGELHTGAILDEKAEEILKMQDNFIPAVISDNIEVEATVPEKRSVTVNTENEKETNFTVSPEANKIIESISDNENPLSAILKLRKAMKAQVSHNLKEIQNNVPSTSKELDFDRYYQDYTTKVVNHVQQKHSSKEVDQVKDMMNQPQTKKAFSFLVSTCYTAETDAKKREECLEMVSDQFLMELDNELTNNREAQPLIHIEDTPPSKQNINKTDIEPKVMLKQKFAKDYASELFDNMQKLSILAQAYNYGEGKDVSYQDIPAFKEFKLACGASLDAKQDGTVVIKFHQKCEKREGYPEIDVASDDVINFMKKYNSNVISFNCEGLQCTYRQKR